MKTKIISLLLLVAILTLSIAACATDAAPVEHPPDGATQAEQVPESSEGAPEDVGEGATVFLFSVTTDTGAELFWNVHTDQSTVGEALVEVGLILGDDTEFGLMVTHVNGLRADFTEDSAWWAFYIDGEMAMMGVDATEIEEGVTYAFVFTPA